MTALNDAASRNNRADQIRQRKVADSNKRTSSATRRATEAPAPVKPVTVRNTTFGTPVRQRVATSNPRRQYYVALSTPGTELRLPALPTLRLGVRGISATLLIVCLIGIFSILFSPVFALGSPLVNGMKRLTQTDIEAALNLENLSILELNPAALSASLIKAYPLIKSASVSIAMPNQVNVTIVEREPVLAWQVGDKATWIDVDGVLFPQTGEAPGLLTIHADSQPPLYVSAAELKAREEAAKKAADALAAGKPVSQASATATASATLTPEAPATIDPDLSAAMRKLIYYFPDGLGLVYSSQHGIGWTDAGGWEVYVGKNLKDFDQKYALYQSISQQLTGQSITPAIISVEYVDAPYYRLEK